MSFVVLNCQGVEWVDIFANPVFKNPCINKKLQIIIITKKRKLTEGKTKQNEQNIKTNRFKEDLSVHGASPFTLLSGHFEGGPRFAANPATVDRPRHCCLQVDLFYVNPATSATGERSFSKARRIKTWLRSKMLQVRFKHLAIWTHIKIDLISFV